MIKKLWGVADNHTLSFTQCKKEHWQAEIPKDLEDGEYIVEIFAEDFAGNTAYYTDLFFTIDTGNLCFHIEKKPYKVEFLENSYTTKLIKQEFELEILRRHSDGQ